MKEYPIFHPDLGRVNGDTVLESHLHSMSGKVYLLYKCASRDSEIPDYALVMGRIETSSYKDDKGRTIVQCDSINEQERGKLRATVPNRLRLGMGTEIFFIDEIVSV